MKVERENGRLLRKIARATGLFGVVLPTRSAVTIRRRCVSRPTERPQILLEKLGLRLPTGIIQNQM